MVPDPDAQRVLDHLRDHFAISEGFLSRPLEIPGVPPEREAIVLGDLFEDGWIEGVKLEAQRCPAVITGLTEKARLAPT